MPNGHNIVSAYETEFGSVLGHLVGILVLGYNFRENDGRVQVLECSGPSSFINPLG